MKGVKKNLSLSPEHAETMLNKSFRSDQENNRVCDKVRLSMMLNNGGIWRCHFHIYSAT